MSVSTADSPNDLKLEILPQPTETTCGPTCLHAVYRYYGDPISLQDVIRQVPSLTHGGTLAVLLAIHALKRGYRARLHTYNLKIVDPTWFNPTKPDLAARLLEREKRCNSRRKCTALRAYREFVELGGELVMQDLSAGLLRKYLKRGQPILTGLSATYLYQSARENPETNRDDDIHGEPGGHFVVVSGYDKEAQLAHIADPYRNPFTAGQYYSVSLERLICAILLGVVTYDANLLVLMPAPNKNP
jgi:hypothetical protein